MREILKYLVANELLREEQAKEILLEIASGRYTDSISKQQPTQFYTK